MPHAVPKLLGESARSTTFTSVVLPPLPLLSIHVVPLNDVISNQAARPNAGSKRVGGGGGGGARHPGRAAATKRRTASRKLIVSVWWSVWRPSRAQVGRQRLQ